MIRCTLIRCRLPGVYGRWPVSEGCEAKSGELYDGTGVGTWKWEGKV